jgi:hypothetical protein
MGNARVRGRPIAPVVLSAQERAYLERQVRRQRVARSLSERCRVILRAARHDLVVRRTRYRVGVRHRQMLQASPGGRVLELPQRGRCSSPRRARYPVACPPAALSFPLYANFGVMDQSGRALVCRTRQKAAPSWCSYLCQATRSRYPRLHRSAQPKSQALQMDQICRPNPGFSETLLPQSAADIMRRTLDSHD